MTDTSFQLEQPITCRRCRRDYLPPRRRMIFPACPHCGAAPRPLLRRLTSASSVASEVCHDGRAPLRHNGVAALLALAAMVTLAVGVTSPFLSMTKLGETRQFSLVGGIVELFRTGNTLIALVLLVFSVIFPFAKLLALLIATSRLAPISLAARKRLHYLAAVTGKYSLLDILVVAIVIVVVKFRGVADARAMYGTTIFCVAIFLSILSGFAVNIAGDDDQPAAHGAAPTTAGASEGSAV